MKVFLPDVDPKILKKRALWALEEMSWEIGRHHVYLGEEEVA